MSIDYEGGGVAKTLDLHFNIAHAESFCMCVEQLEEQLQYVLDSILQKFTENYSVNWLGQTASSHHERMIEWATQTKVLIEQVKNFRNEQNSLIGLAKDIQQDGMNLFIVPDRGGALCGGKDSIGVNYYTANEVNVQLNYAHGGIDDAISLMKKAAKLLPRQMRDVPISYDADELNELTDLYKELEIKRDQIEQAVARRNALISRLGEFEMMQMQSLERLYQFIPNEKVIGEYKKTVTSDLQMVTAGALFSKLFAAKDDVRRKQLIDELTKILTEYAKNNEKLNYDNNKISGRYVYIQTEINGVPLAIPVRTVDPWRLSPNTTDEQIRAELIALTQIYDRVTNSRDESWEEVKKSIPGYMTGQTHEFIGTLSFIDAMKRLKLKSDGKQLDPYDGVGVPTTLEAFHLAKDAYDQTPSKELIEGNHVVMGWKLDEIYKKGSLEIFVYKKTIKGKDYYTIVNRGSDNGDDFASENFLQPIGLSGDMLNSKDFALKFIDRNANAGQVTFVGHSKGGAEAIANAIATNKNVIAINSANLWVDSNFLKKQYENYTGTITQYSVDGELLDALSVADHQGTTINLPKQYDGKIDNHGMDAAIRAMEEHYFGKVAADNLRELAATDVAAYKKKIEELYKQIGYVYHDDFYQEKWEELTNKPFWTWGQEE